MFPVMLFAAALSTNAVAGDPVPPAMDKATKHASLSAELPFPAEQVWEVIALDYGRIADSHPLIVKSDYLHGSLEGELGAERACWFNDKGTRTLEEQIIEWDPENMRFTNRVLAAQGFPLDPDNTLGTWSVESLGSDRSRVTFDMQFRAKPAFMTGMMVGAFENLIADYMLAVEHHLATGESVTRDNFKEIAKSYRKGAAASDIR